MRSSGPLYSRVGASIFNINVQSLNNKVDQLDNVLHRHYPEVDVLCVTEHWLRSPEIMGVSIGEFRFGSYFSRRESGHGGGDNKK